MQGGCLVRQTSSARHTLLNILGISPIDWSLSWARPWPCAFLQSCARGNPSAAPSSLELVFPPFAPGCCIEGRWNQDATFAPQDPEAFVLMQKPRLGYGPATPGIAASLRPYAVLLATAPGVCCVTMSHMTKSLQLAFSEAREVMHFSTCMWDAKGSDENHQKRQRLQMARDPAAKPSVEKETYPWSKLIIWISIPSLLATMHATVVKLYLAKSKSATRTNPSHTKLKAHYSNKTVCTKFAESLSDTSKTTASHNSPSEQQCEALTQLDTTFTIIGSLHLWKFM